MWGFLIALALTAVAVVLAMNAKKGFKPGVLSWIVAAVGFVGLWILGTRLAGNIESRSNALALKERISAGVTDFASSEFSGEVGAFVSDYGVADAASDFVVGERVHFYTVRMWIDVVLLVVVLVAMALLFVVFMEGKRGGYSRATERHGGSGRNPKYHSRRR